MTPLHTTFLAFMITMMQLITLSKGFCNHHHCNHRRQHSSFPTTTNAAAFRPRRHQVSSSQLFARKKKKQKTPSSNFDMKELQNRIKEVMNPYHELFAEQDGWDAMAAHERPDNVWIILFKPDTEEQGLHTIEYPPQSGSNYVLAFESEEACAKFSAAVATTTDQSFGQPSPKLYDIESLDSFCDMLGVFIQVIPEGKEILPPTQNVQAIGQHNPNLKDEKYHLDYIFDMFELEVDELGLLVVESGSWE